MFSNFLKKEAVGLDISDYSIEVVSFSGSAKNPKLSALGRIILEPGIVENGKIIKKEELKNYIEKLFKNLSFGKIKTKKIIFSLPESKSFICSFDLPEGIKNKEKLKYIELQAEQKIPFSLSDIYFDFQVRDKEVLLVASPKEIVNDYLDVFKNCRLYPIVLEVESVSLVRVFTRKNKGSFLVVDIGDKTANFGVCDQNGLRTSFSIDIAGNRFSRALSEKLKISFDEAEKLKKEIGLNPRPKSGKVFLILQNEIQGIIKKIAEISDYFLEKSGKKIEKIFLAGGSSKMPRLLEYLNENLEIEVAIIDPWSEINIDEENKKYSEAESFLYLTVIGLALRGLYKNPEKKGINLIKENKKSFPQILFTKIFHK